MGEQNFLLPFPQTKVDHPAYQLDWHYIMNYKNEMLREPRDGVRSEATGETQMR